MNRPYFSSQARRIALFLASIALVATVANIYAAYQTTRPIAEGTFGYINQTNKYGEGAVHKGVDFPAALDTDVIAIADGIVQQVEENFQDACAPPACPDFGNFILVRQTRQHYDRTTGQMAYVYSLYAHLSWQGAFVAPGNNVVAGQVIGDVDDTGMSTSNHLHLQIMIDTNANRTVTYPLSWTESNSRNPELWLRPYNGSTGTVVGKVTNVNGDPVGGLLVFGLQKQAAWGYGSNLTYNSTALKPDDILVENWGTTDVTPGTYIITLSNGSNLGQHTIRAGQITHVGLYPVWLPDVYAASGWKDNIIMRNDNGTFRAQVNLTYSNDNGLVNSQVSNYYVNTNAVANFAVSNGFAGTAIDVPSENAPVVNHTRKPSAPSSSAAYTGLNAISQGDPSSGVVGTNVYFPHVYRQYYNFSSVLNILNAGPSSSSITIRFYDINGVLKHTTSLTLASGQKTTLDLYGMSGLPLNFLGSAKIESLNSPVAAVADALGSNGQDLNYTALNGATTAYMPYLMRQYYNWNSCFTIRNTAGGAHTVRVQFYSTNPTFTRDYNLANAQAGQVVCQTNDTSLPAGQGFSAKAWSLSNQPFAIAVNQDNTINGQEMSYSAPSRADSTIVVLPYLMKAYVMDGQTLNSGFRVQNVGNGTTTPTVTYYNANGTVAAANVPLPIAIAPGYSAGIYVPNITQLPNGFFGSAVISANQPIVAVGNGSCSAGCTGDHSFTYNGVNR